MSILVTEPSPDIPPASSISSLQTDPPSTLVHVLVHRESEEYQTDLEDSNPDKGMLSVLCFVRYPVFLCSIYILFYHRIDRFVLLEK